MTKKDSHQVYAAGRDNHRWSERDRSSRAVLCRGTGSGISSEDIPHLFERFWQAHRTGRQGTGLGLSIVHGIVTAHGGQVWVESQGGIGTTFFFTLPLARRDAGAPGGA